MEALKLAEPVNFMLPRDLQASNERMFARKHIDGYIRKMFTDTPAAMQRVEQGVQYLRQWLSYDYFESKQIRLNQVKWMDLHSLVFEIFVGTVYCRRPELFVSVTGQLASRLNFDDKADSIATIAEITAVLCHTDVFNITKESNQASLMLVSNMNLPRGLEDAIERSQYLPPMVCEPMEITSNNQSGYLTFNDNLVLGRGNSHNGNLCLDTINTQNKIPLKLDLAFLSTVEEEPKEPLDSMDQIQQWKEFKRQSYETYLLMAKQGNRFHLTHKPDKRGRMYAQGYHITSQGSAFKKAMIELAEEELIHGVPQ